MAELTVEQSVDAFFGEWMKTVELVMAAFERKEFESLREVEQLWGHNAVNSINRAGNILLTDAARGLLWREKLSAKLSIDTGRRALIGGLEAHLPKARRTGILSEHAVIAKATKSLREHSRNDGVYIFPVVFARQATQTDFRMGAARLMAKAIFEADMASRWDEHNGAADEMSVLLAKDWHRHSEDFDHFIAVQIDSYEETMAWPAARDAAETMLNVIRMYFRFHAMDDVRIGNGFIWQTRRSRLRLSKAGGVCLSTSLGGSGSHLEDGWTSPIECQLLNFSVLLATAVSWHAHNDGRKNPILERLTYFNRLISEAYCEPHHPIRLVRLISALEALSMISGPDKAHNLAHRCGAAGGWGDTSAYCEIYDAIRDAYRWRNAVVHGDAPSEDKVLGAFYAVERRLLWIYLGMLALHSGIANDVAPQSVTTLRREFANRIDMFFWAPSLVT